MAPLFKIGRIRINRRHIEFVEQWVNFDPEKKNQDDDLLDAVEIAIGVTGALLPQTLHESLIEGLPRNTDPSEIAQQQLARMRAGGDKPYDPELGSEA
jgi:hypothetical protein